MAKEQYSRVPLIVKAVRPKSIIVVKEEGDVDVTLGRSTLSYLCDQEMDTLETPQEAIIEAMTWLLKKENLL